MLLQEIRLKQALEEIGAEVEYKFSHSEPYIDIFDKRYTLIFPKYMFDYEAEKTIETLFIGLKTDKRERFLNKFNAKIIYTNRGRDQTTKQKDEWYFNEMAKAKFVLCPDGDFVWTYRFFEAIIFNAIPIVQNVAKCYEGYKFYEYGDEFIYRQDWIEYNINKLKKEMTL